MNQPHHRKRNSVIILLVLVAFGAVLYLLAGKTSVNLIIPKTNADHKQTVKQDFQDASFEGNGKWYGLCKKNSIHSIDDFRNAVSSDPVLKAHYADFKWENAKMGRLEKATSAYVYYRKDDTIFRKQTPIVLAAGDGYITDGNVSVRTQCCNSYVAGPPVSEMTDLDADPSAGAPPPVEPPPFNPPPFDPPPPVDPPPPFNPPPFDPPPPFNPPSVCVNPPCEPPPPVCENPPCEPPPPVCVNPPCEPPPPPPPPPPPVPEPSTISLLGIGIVYFLVLFFIFRKAKLRHW